jgi:hypothetical protein
MGSEAADWKRLPLGGWKFATSEVLCFVTPEEVHTTIQDGDIPTWGELTDDGEIFADGIPEFVEKGREAEKNLEQWQRQGWWPKPVRVERWRIHVRHRATKLDFESNPFESCENALTAAKVAVAKIALRRRPEWMRPSP